MELDFDKEIDALLRKARSGTHAATAVHSPTHLDADEISAFAENALPEKIRQTYIMHFAECDRCRKILSQAILLNAEAEQEAASSPLIAAPVEESLPWYRNILRLPVLAYTMGTLTLLFSGFLGYIVWQNTAERSSEVSQVSNRAASNAPLAANTAIAPPSISASNAASNAVNSMVSTNTANIAVIGSAPTTTNSSANTGGGPLIAGGRGLSAPGYDEEAKPAAKPLPEAPTEQPAAAAPAPLRDLNEKDKQVADDKIAQSKNDLSQLEAEKQGQASGRLQAMKKEQRREGPVAATKTTDLPVNGRKAESLIITDGTARSDSAKRFGGRTFQRKEGVWYDSNYHGQATINVSRGTDSYKKLDSGLRSIADSMSGTVVVVWKSKAYRIQ